MTNTIMKLQNELTAMAAERDAVIVYNKNLQEWVEDYMSRLTSMTEEARLCREEWNRANRYWCGTKDQLAAMTQERDEAIKIRNEAILENNTSRHDLAIAQARIKELREALERCESMFDYHYIGTTIAQAALATPDDSSALDAPSSEEVREMVERLRSCAEGFEKPWQSDYAKAADLIERLAARVPDGCVIVPREPTEAMIAATDGAYRSPVSVWNTMIAAGEVDSNTK